MKMKIVGLLILIASHATAVMIQETAWIHNWYDWKNLATENDYCDYYQVLCNQLGITENPKIPKVAKNDAILRIATYNVHYWQQPLGKPWGNWSTLWTILSKIVYLDIDILILQEVGLIQDKNGNVCSYDAIERKLNEHGFVKFVFGDSVTLRNYIFVKDYVEILESFSKQFDTNPANKSEEQRSFARLKVQLPGGKKLVVYGTHLAIKPVIVSGAAKSGEEVRFEQMRELLDYINVHDEGVDVVIGLDSNTVREKDLMDKIRGETIWSMYTAREKQGNREISTKALELAAQRGYLDSFEKASIMPPNFTNMYGTKIDFLLLNSAWSLPIEGCYAFYSHASDHIPIIMDIKTILPLNKSRSKVLH